MSSDPWPDALGEFGSQLRRLRDDANLTQQTLAKRIGTSDSTLSALELGKGDRVPTEDLVMAYIDRCLEAWGTDQAMTTARRADLVDQYRLLGPLRARLRSASDGDDTAEFADEQALRERLRLGPRGASNAIDLSSLPAETEWITDDRMVPSLSAPPPRSRPACEVRFPVLVRRMATWSVVALLGLLGAVLLIPTAISPFALGAVAVLSLFVGCYLLLASLLFRALIRVILAVERKASTQTGIEYVLRGAVLALLMVVVGYVGISYAAAGLPAPWRGYLPVAVVGGVVWWAVGAGMRGYRIDRAARSAGVPGVVAGWRRDGKPESFVWRRAAQGLYDRLTGSPEWRRPWSMVRRDRIRKEYDALLDAHAILRCQAARPWRQWLAEDHARAAALGTVWAAGTVGLVLVVVVELVRTGHSLLRMVGVAVGAIVLVCGIAIAVVRLGHSSMRHRDTQLAAELDEALATLQPLIQDQPTD